MSWEQLLAIKQEAEQEAELRASQPPQACPNDGEPLREGPDGVLFCRFDGWKWSC
jgi:hypothetical protein